MAKTPGDPHDPDDIIELTDIIEHGPGAPKAEGGAGGVDLSFERELEDLFSDVPGEPKGKGDDLPGLEDLHIPESGEPAPASEPDIDLEGLDDLLAEAESSPPSAGSDLPELPDDFSDDLFDKPLEDEAPRRNVLLEEDPTLTMAPAELAAQGPAMDALVTRIDGLEASLASLSDSLPQSCRNMIDESLEALKAELGQDAPDLSELERSLREGLAADLETRLAETASEAKVQLDALREELAQSLPDQAGLEASLSAKLEESAQSLETRLTGLETGLDELRSAAEMQTESSDEEPETVRLAADVAAMTTDVAALRAELQDLVERMPEAPDVQALTEAVAASVLERIPPAQDPAPQIEALRAELQALGDRTPETPDTQALTEAVAASVLERIPPAQDPAPQIETLRAELQALDKRVTDDAASAETESLRQALEGFGDRLSALEASVAGLPTDLVAKPDLDQRFDNLKALLLAEVERAVPQAAARIIREEIQALLAQDME